MKTLMRTLMMSMLGAMLAGCTSLTGGPAPEGSDESVRLAVVDRLERDPVTARLNIGVTVDGGVVTLTGRAMNPAQRAQAEAIAKGTPGVKGVAENFFAR
jgi:osmotically-inducible protein OsmY